ncbi:TobH protein [Mycobacterium sp. MYCO198283]|uniref:TobH protein n=1 Tax=Mycobacterium sp. MYCO198283 TaxID=2883505 RepID=UPI001E454765|nr:TobH protein [Mycobacterium sp. MYCO198283]MCG5431621.1 TobH protein [Mycobacterium sp. MYCO198283]
MSAPSSAPDLDDAEGLAAADRDGLLRAVATAGASVRAVAATAAEGGLDALRDSRPRSVVWISGRGTAGTAGALLAAGWGATSVAPIAPASGVPPWVGPLDVVVVAGDDPGDPALVAAASGAVRRGARVVVAAPFEGPLRDATAGRAAVLAPRLWLPDAFNLSRYLAVGLVTLAAVDPVGGVDVAALADALDAEALRNAPAAEMFTNPAKALAQRLSGDPAVLTADSAALLAVARHGSATLLRIAGAAVPAAELPDVVTASRDGMLATARAVTDIFHDDELDGPRPGRTRVLALAARDERAVVAARLAAVPDVDFLDVDEADTVVRGDHEPAVLAVRLEMAAVYLRLLRSPV